MRQRFVFPCVLASAIFLTLALPGRAAANMVTNGGFETGDFTGWTQIGNTDFNGVSCPGAGSVTEGSCEAVFGPIGTTGGITQTLATTVGQNIYLSFDYMGDGGVPGSFEVGFGGRTLLAQANAPAATKSFTFSMLASAATTDLTFLFRDDTGFMVLDNVQVAPVPEPTNLALLGIGLAGLVARRGWRGRKASGR